MKETELAEKIIANFPEDIYEIFPEVPGGGGIIDIVVRQNKIVTAIECKCVLSFDVIYQAVAAIPAHYSYIAVPKSPNHIQERICKMFGIGVLVYFPHHDNDEDYPSVEERIKPKFNRKVIPLKLHDWMKRSKAGSQNDRMTSFKYFVEEIHRELRRALPAGKTHKELFNDIYRHYGKPEYLKNNLIAYIKSGVVKNVVYKDKRFYYEPEPKTDIG